VPKSWRIVKTRFAPSSFDGEGARKFGGRFNSVGVPVIYTAATRSLAILEMMVHIGDEKILPSYSLCSIEFDAALVEKLELSDLPANWQDDPPPPELLALGDVWIASNRSVVLQVPSVIVPDESNYLINPMHRAFFGLSIGAAVPISFDTRLLKK
jgi:RES domain-containing protein